MAYLKYEDVEYTQQQNKTKNINEKFVHTRVLQYCLHFSIFHHDTHPIR